MKIIHCADLHLDSKMESNLSSAKAKERREELLCSYERMVDFARDNDVRAILLAGDTFDKMPIKVKSRKRFLEKIENNPEIEFYYLKGNHDRCEIIEEGKEKPQNLHLFKDEWTTYDLDGIKISGIEIDKNNNRTLSTTLVLNQEEFNVVMLHGQISDYSGNDKTEIINISELKNSNIDYLALGHIHSFSGIMPLGDRGSYAYSGALEGRGFDETGDKGFVLLDIEDKSCEAEFIPFSNRRLHELEVCVSPNMTMSQIIDKCDESLYDVDDKDLIKFVLTGNTEVDFEMDLDRIYRKFDERFYFVKIYDKTSPVIHFEDFVNDKSLKGEFIRLLQNKEGLTEEERLEIIEMGIKAIMGEELD